MRYDDEVLIVIAAATVAIAAAAALEDDSSSDDSSVSTMSSMQSDASPVLLTMNASNDNEREVEEILVEIDWAERLKSWLDCFATGTATWGLVTYHLPNRAKRQRHGVIVELTVDVTRSILDEDANSDGVDQLFKIRQAIDLVQLMLAVQPTAIFSVLLRQHGDEWSDGVPSYEEELQAMARGAPVELRLRFEFKSIRTKRLQQRVVERLMRVLDWARLSTNEAFQLARRELLLRLIRDRDKTIRLLRTTARAVLVVDSTQGSDAASGLATEDFFSHLAAFTNDLCRYQRGRVVDLGGWVMQTKHAPFEIETIQLRLGRLCITPRAVQAAVKLSKAGIRVECMRLHLDLGGICCVERDLEQFVSALTRNGSPRLFIETRGAVSQGGVVHVVDAEGEDRRAPIRLLMPAIFSIDHIHGLNIGGLLQQCTSSLNREEIWRDLFYTILTRERRVEVLAFSSVRLREEDAAMIERHATNWHLEHPGKKIRVGTLELLLEESNLLAVRALLAAVDDAEKVTVWHEEADQPLGKEELMKILRYPSLRGVRLYNVNVPTMDLFDPSVLDPRIPVKPVLEELVLECLTLQDQTSLLRFIRKLKPDATMATTTTSGLAATLQRLRVLQHDEGFNEVPIFDLATTTVLLDMLQSNRVLSEVGMSVDVHDGTVHAKRTQLVLQTGRHLPAPQTIEKTEIVKARNVAFLSVIRGDRDASASSARCGLDACIVRQICQFCAPSVERKMDVQWLNI